MREKGRYLIFALAFLSLFAFFVPQALADSQGDPANIPTGADAPPVTPNCPSQNATDAAYFTMRAGDLQRTATKTQNLSTLFPVAPALSACVQNIMNLMKQTPNFADPGGIVGPIVSNMITSLIGQTCSSLMGTITSAQGAITDLAKICIPLPKFNGLDLPTFSAPSCSSGTPISLISGWSEQPSLMTIDNNNNPYLK